MHKLPWRKRKPLYSRDKNEWHSISAKLRSEKKSSDEFEVMVSKLTLEELISLKLEVSARAINNKLYGFDIWKKMPQITRQAVLRYAHTGTRSLSEMATFLGISREALKDALHKYDPMGYLKK